jgi:V/A-type H+-transporting ATPase subunit B
MFVNQASDPMVERLLCRTSPWPWRRRFAVENKRVLVLMTDMTAYADALKESGHRHGTDSLQPGLHGRPVHAPWLSLREGLRLQGGGVGHDPHRHHHAGGRCDSPVPDNTGYITEGQFYLHDASSTPSAPSPV